MLTVHEACLLSPCWHYFSLFSKLKCLRISKYGTAFMTCPIIRKTSWFSELSIDMNKKEIIEKMKPTPNSRNLEILIRTIPNQIIPVTMIRNEIGIRRPNNLLFCIKSLSRKESINNNEPPRM